MMSFCGSVTSILPILSAADNTSTTLHYLKPAERALRSTLNNSGLQTAYPFNVVADKFFIKNDSHSFVPQFLDALPCDLRHEYFV